jgi:glucose-1-phosphatase
MSLRAVIFDLGGVIVRTEHKEPRARLAAELGLTYAELEQLVFGSGAGGSGARASLGQISADQHWRNVAAALGLPPDESARLRTEFFAGDRVDPELVAFIRSLRPGYKTALLSNAWDDLRRWVAEVWRFADAFDHMTISAEAGLAKPDPRIYELTLTALGVQATEAVFVDDFAENVAAARALGMLAVRFTGREQALAELRDHLRGS